MLQILEPSKEVALQLLESGRQNIQTRKLGLDMLRQLSLHHDYVLLLVQDGHYNEALRYARKYQVIVVYKNANCFSKLYSSICFLAVSLFLLKNESFSGHYCPARIVSPSCLFIQQLTTSGCSSEIFLRFYPRLSNYFRFHHLLRHFERDEHFHCCFEFLITKFLQ